jgi:hypothetical protein
MIHLIPRRLAATIAAVAFALAMGEGVLAAVCAPDAEMEACIEGEMMGMDAEMPMDGASFDGALEDAHAAAAGGCCPPVGPGSEPRPGGEERAPCPFTPMGVTGSCQGAAFLATAEGELPHRPDVSGILDPPVTALDRLLDRALFQPPRA